MYLANIVKPASNRSTRRLWSTESSLYDVPRLRAKFGKTAFSFTGLSVWNALPADIRDETCTADCKRKLKTFYFSLASDCIWHRFYVTTDSGGSTKFFNLNLKYGFCMSGSRCRFAYGPADATATNYLLLQKIQMFLPSWFSFLVPAHPSSPGQNPRKS